MKFIDEAKVYVSGGDGGSGAVSWRREKYLPKGGPDGGNGGNGGAVVFCAEDSLNTLIDFSFNPHVAAGKGGNGDANRREGKSGEDLFCPVPVGTQVFYKGELVADLSAPNARWVAARGGRGGKGNTHFKTPTLQAPDFAQPGMQGEKFEFLLVLKSVADVGLLGLPNVGKSTLVSAITKSHPKIADYPFTTLRPSLGVVLVDKKRRFVIADIPGLIPGAHEGKGLGIQFLRHIERTAVLAQLIDVSADNRVQDLLTLGEEISDELLQTVVKEQFESLDLELSSFSEELHAKPRLVVFSKCDVAPSERAQTITKEFFDERNLATHLISSHRRDGLDELIAGLASLLETSTTTDSDRSQ